jgi:hypothetical protein
LPYLIRTAWAEHAPWIENSFSFGFRLQLAARFELGGVAIEDASTGPGAADVWPALLESTSMGRPQLVRPNGELFVPQWEADGGEFLEGGDASVVWKAPETPGTYHITLIVSDGMTRVGQRLTITVKQ